MNDKLLACFNGTACNFKGSTETIQGKRRVWASPSAAEENGPTWFDDSHENKREIKRKRKPKENISLPLESRFITRGAYRTFSAN
jgi:hypothetical protein